MQRFQNILYVSDGTSDETEGLKQALSLARNNQAALHVLVVGPALPNDFSSHKEKFEAALVETVSTAIHGTRAALQMSQNEPPVTVEAECGKAPAVRIIRRVLRAAHDLVVKQAEATSGAAGFRSLDMQLLRQCPCPLWLSRPITRHREDIRVAVAIDPRYEEPAEHDLAIELLRLARALADTCDGELIVISCWDYEFESSLRHQPWIQVSEDDIAKEVLSAERDHGSRLKAIVDESGIGGDIRFRNERGRPDRRIPTIAKEAELDILVMGTVSRTGIPGFLIGNTAENVLGALECSVIAMKPNGFVSSVKAY